MARFQRRSFQRRSPRRATSWIGGENTTTSRQSLVAGGSLIVISFDTRVVSGIDAPFTIIRLRGDFRISSDQVAVQENPFGAAGAMVVNGEAFDAGVASMPTPVTESFDDRWMWHQYWSAQTEIGGTNNSVAHYPIDSKSMRKIELGDVFVVVLENQNTTQAASFVLNMRILAKLV